MVRSQDIIKKEFSGEAFQLLQIHDELLFEVKKDRIPEFAKKIKKILEDIYKGDVVLKVEAKVGENWGEMEKYAILK